MSLSKTIFLTAVVLAGCASAPELDYYTLSVERSGEARPSLNLEVERLATTRGVRLGSENNRPARARCPARPGANRPGL